MIKKYVLFWLAACILFSLDRLTKLWAESTLTLGHSVTAISGWYDWALIHNPGAAGGMFSGHVGVLILIAIVAVGGILWFVYSEHHDRNIWLLLGLGLLLGGALGNLFDRIVYQYVIDFIAPIDASYIYNVADKGIRWGLYLGLFGLWRSGRNAAKARRQQEESQNNAVS